jgi:hypothetical protein
MGRSFAIAFFPEIPICFIIISRFFFDGFIKSLCDIALNAAFLAAGENRPVSMHHLAKAARREYIKIEKMITAAEFGSRYQP